MESFFISEIFRLEIRWKSVEYSKDGMCSFVEAFLSGPAVSIAQKINEKDSIFLDFYSQYIRLVKGVYVAKFSWFGTEYSEDGKSIMLKNAKLEHELELNNVPVLKDSDFFVVDTSDHTPEKHGNNLLYKTFLLNSDNYLYRFYNV